MRYKFRIPIGDWSGDGHGNCHWAIVSATAPIEKVREAYWAACEKLPKLIPTTYAEKYQDNSFPQEVQDELLARGFPLREGYDEGQEIWLDVDLMADIVIWFLNQGDPSLDCQIEDEDIPMLHFFGNDEKGRHLNFIGYGLLGG